VQPQILIPDPSPGPQTKELYQQWREDKRAVEEVFVPVNVRFAHDPEWREHWLSMTAAREQRFLVWKIVGWLFLGAQLSWSSAFYMR
jgi:metal-sulfur cluster biosynthetic enzyme